MMGPFSNLPHNRWPMPVAPSMTRPTYATDTHLHILYPLLSIYLPTPSLSLFPFPYPISSFVN